MSVPSPSFSTLLLAGGRSRRMGEDKALLSWQGRPLWEVQLEKLRSLIPVQIFIACRREQGLTEVGEDPSPVTWLYDPPGEDLGPIAAIARALGQTDLPLLTIAVDMPLLTAQFLNTWMAKERPEDSGFFFESAHGIEPMAGIYSPGMLPLFTDAISRGDYSLQSIIRMAVTEGLARLEPLPEDAHSMFEGANTPAEWARTAPQV